MSLIKLAFQIGLEKEANKLSDAGELVTSTLMQNGKQKAAQLMTTDVGDALKAGVGRLASMFKKPAQQVIKPKRALSHLGQAYMGAH